MRFHAFVCILLTFSALAQQSPAPKPEITPAEARSRKLWEDYKNRDKAALKTTLDENFRALEEGGDFFGAADYISSLDGFELKSYDLNDYKVVALGADSVLLTYHARYEGASGGETTHGNAGFSEVWVRHGKTWKIQYLQETYVK